MHDRAPWDGTIRRSRPEELDALGQIELDANIALIDAGVVFRSGPTATPRDLMELSLSEGLLFVAVNVRDEPVGFLAGHERDGGLYVGEIDVLRCWQRRGVGRSLMLTALSEARSRRLWGVMLTTDRLVPFNGPFYASIGFREVARGDMPPSLEGVLAAELASGQDAARRVGMVVRFP